MFDAVPIDVPRFYGLADFGEPAGLVLTPAAPRSSALAYRIPVRRGSRRAWLKVRLRATVVTARDHGTRGLGAVVLYTDGRASASAEFMPIRRRGGMAVRWSEVALHHAERHVTKQDRFTVSLDNYARTQGATAGLHRMSFGIRLNDGIRVRKVVVHPGSGLILSRQPPQALTISSVVSPTTPSRSEPFTVQYSVRNIGILPSGPVRLPALLPPSVAPAGPSPRIASIPAGGKRTAELRLRASEAGDYRIQTLAQSEVGQALDEISVRVVESESAGTTQTSGSGDGTRMAIALSSIAAAIAISAALYFARRHRART